MNVAVAVGVNVGVGVEVGVNVAVGVGVGVGEHPVSWNVAKIPLDCNVPNELVTLAVLAEALDTIASKYAPALSTVPVLTFVVL